MLSDDALPTMLCRRARACRPRGVVRPMELARELADRGVVRLPNFLTAEELEICQESANERFGSILRAMLLKQVLAANEWRCAIADEIQRSRRA